MKPFALFLGWLIFGGKFVLVFRGALFGEGLYSGFYGYFHIHKDNRTNRRKRAMPKDPLGYT